MTNERNELYGREEISELLRALDKELDVPAEIVIIGGSAAALAYQSSMATRDVDLIRPLGRMKAAIERAIADTGIQIEFDVVGVYDAPYNFEGRLQTVKVGNLKRLTVKVPEKHDLVLMKAMRFGARDAAMIEEIHKKEPLDYNVLLARIQSEMGHVTGDHRTLRGNWLQLFERLFGEKIAAESERQLKAWGTSRKGRSKSERDEPDFEP